jgi:hypothetical protein
VGQRAVIRDDKKPRQGPEVIASSVYPPSALPRVTIAAPTMIMTTPLNHGFTDNRRPFWHMVGIIEAYLGDDVLVRFGDMVTQVPAEMHEQGQIARGGAQRH